MVQEDEAIMRQNQAQIAQDVGNGLAESSLTYDPTQGLGTPAWQESVRASAELNARRRQARNN